MERQPVGVHPVLACADAIEQALKDVRGVDPDFMKTDEKAAALRRLDRLADQVTALRLRVMAGAGDVADATADHSVATWLAAETRTDPRDRAGELALARSLERRWTRMGAAVADGSVNLPQASVIARALEELPAQEVGPEAVVRAEEALIEYAATYAPRELRRLGRRILEVAAPDTCDQAEGRALEREERGRRGRQFVSASARRRDDPDHRTAAGRGGRPAAHLSRGPYLAASPRRGRG